MVAVDDHWFRRRALQLAHSIYSKVHFFSLFLLDDMDYRSREKATDISIQAPAVDGV